MDTTLDLSGGETTAERLRSERPADIVAALNALSHDAAEAVLERLPLEIAVAVFDTPGLDAVHDLFERMLPQRAASILSGMSVDRAAEIVRNLDRGLRAGLLKRVTPDTRAALNRVLKYPQHTVGAIMTTEYVTARSDWSVAETLEHIRRVERSRETIYAIYVLDVKTKKLLNAVTLRRLIMGEDDAPVLSVVAESRPVTVQPLMDREEVARLISKYDLLAVPVVERGKLLGIVTVDDVIDAILQETTEDVQRFGGVGPIDEPYMQIGLLQMIRKRAGWLSVLFVSEMLTASAMQHFDDELQRAIVLTLFIPLIMSSGGNSGSQATSLLIRALALGEVRLTDWWRIALRELPTGLVLGGILGLVGVIRIATWQYFGIYDYGPHWVLVAATVATALIGVVTFGTLSGSMLPFALKRLGFDPASASAPFVATLVDVTGLVIYFSVALSILRGTLL